MPKSKRTRRSRRLAGKDPAALVSSVPTGGVVSSRFTPNQAIFPHALRRRINGRVAVPCQYTTLSEDLREIRLMTLHEGDFAADIIVSLHTAPLTSDRPPIYEALSYVWGSTENPIDIHVGLGTLAVTRNLAEALPYLRYEDRPRTLWIDAICVNQQDLKERAHQVNRMTDIYRLADRVVVWLGPEVNNSGQGMKLLEHLGSQIEVHWAVHEVVPASRESESHWSDMAKPLPYGKEELLAISEPLSRPWFERLWVQQEIHLANPQSIFLCGSDTMAWRSLRKAIFGLCGKSWSGNFSLSLEKFQNRLDSLQKIIYTSTTKTLVEVMEDTSHCKCLDPRDRVYAILSLLRKSEMPDDIVPDYGKTSSQVYQDVANRHIAHHNKLSILRLSGLKRTPSEMPTWVPDWTVEIKTIRIAGLACGVSDSIVQYKGASVLSVTGIHSATVQYCEKMNVLENNYETVIAELQRIAKDEILPSSYVGGGNLLTAFCHTFLAGGFAELCWPPASSLPRFQQSLDFLSAVLQPAKQPVPAYGPGTEAHKFLAAARSHLMHRSFMKTHEGYIGLAPRNALPGDQICILLGCQLPMLLRPAPNRQYRVAGECFVPGLNDGEAFLGSLPDHYRLVWSFDQERSDYFSGFLNHRTGKVQYNDPRLESVPNYEYATELTPETIEERGVKLRTFDLI